MNTWDHLLKQMLWKQLDFAQGMRILDFGSGMGETAAHLALRNDVTAVEPSADMLSQRAEGAYAQLHGGIGMVWDMADDGFDMVLCHNVLEYVDEKQAYLRELTRVLKPGGVMSIVKHNRPGRVMQMAVLLNDFDMAHKLLSGGNGATSKFGDIRYYEDADVTAWCPELRQEKIYGARTFWDLQQRQECHTDPLWQERMLALEHRAAEISTYQNIAFFHHLLLRKEG